MGKALQGQVAVITGGGRGIGRAIAEAYAAEGCRLLLVARSDDELNATARAIREATGVAAMTMAVDVSNEEALRNAIHFAHREFARIDILINNAGIIGPLGPLTEIDSAEWMRTIQINLCGTFFGMKAVLPIMRRQRRGRIVNFSGGGALLPAPFFDAYSVTKAGIVRLTENVALECKDTGIMICAIAPAGVNTKIFDDIMAAGEAKLGPELWQSFLRRKEAGGDSLEDVTGLALFLATTEHVRMLHGKVLSAKWDPWRTLTDHAETLASSDIYTMRRVMPKDRGAAW